MICLYPTSEIYFLGFQFETHQMDSYTCPDPTPVNGTIRHGKDTTLPNGTFPVGQALAISCDEGFTMHVYLENSVVLVLICEEHGIWSQPPPECIPNDEGE